MAAAWEYDADPVAPGIQPDYVFNGVACEQFTIVSEEVTWYINYADDSIRGTLDVLITDDAGAPIIDDDILVLLFDQENNLIAWECLNDDVDVLPGWVSFFGVPDGTYTVTATDSAAEFGVGFGCGSDDAWETQDASKVYSTLEDFENDDLL